MHPFHAAQANELYNQMFYVFLAYYLLQAVYSLVLAFVGCYEERRKAYQDEQEVYSSLQVSSFAVPVSVILPAHNEELWILDSVLSILKQRYAQIELIVVDDGSTDNTMKILGERFLLEHVNNPYQDHFKTGKVKGLYKSRMYPNMTVLSKERGGKKAGTVNAGINIAKYKYVCVMDADTVLEEDALIKVMAHVQRDPERIIAMGGYFGLVNGFKVKEGVIVHRRFNHAPIVAYQNLEYIRTFIGTRIAGSRWNIMPNIAGGFGLWRRDILIELGGYSENFSSEDIELTFRAHDYMARHPHKKYRIGLLPYCVGWTEGPDGVGSLIQQRGRWHRVTLETIWHYKHMLLNPRYGLFGFVTVPYFVLYECIGITAELVCLAITAWGFWLGLIRPGQFLGIIVFMVLTQAMISLLPLLTFVHEEKTFKLRDILYLTGLSLVEFFGYRCIVTYAKAKGTFDFFKGVRDYDQVSRNREVGA